MWSSSPSPPSSSLSFLSTSFRGESQSSFLQTWEFLPKPVRSLEPFDRLVVSCLARWRQHKQGDSKRWEGNTNTNKGFQPDQTLPPPV